MTNISRTLWFVCLFCGLNFIQRVHAQATQNPTLMFTPVTPVVNLYEYQDQIKTLITVSCSDPKQLVTVIKYVSIFPASPCGNCFNVYPQVTGSPYDVKFLPGQGVLSYNQVKNYVVTLTCVTPDFREDTKTLEIRIIPNTPPYFNTPGGATTNIINADTMQAGTSIYRATCDDMDDQDSFTYTLTTNPASSLFTIGVTDGVIRAAGNLKAECRTQIAFDVMCKDPYHPAVGPFTIQATLNNPNDKPTITGMNLFLDVPEDKAVGSDLVTFTVSDSDATSCSISTTPLDSLQYFTIGSPTATGGTIQVRNKLNYEQITTRNTNVTVSCTDNYCTSEKAYVYVRITDVNEPITLAPKNINLTTYEGSISLDPGWTTTDEDLNDYPTYSIVGVNPNGRFKVDPTSGLITSTTVYYVDRGAMSMTETIYVQVRDIAGHTATSTVSLSILDANDNRPVFSPQTMQITIDNCSSSIGTSIGTVSARDELDSSFEGNNVITYSGGGGPITIGSTGNIIANAAIAAGNTYTVTAQATDSGVHTQRLSAATPATITVIVTPCPPTTTPAPTTTTSAAPTTTKLVTTTLAPVTVAPNSANSLEKNMGWIVVAGLLATVFLAALGLMLWKFCWPAVCAAGKANMFFERLCGECCQSRPSPRTVQPARGQPPKAGNKSFWQERYPDDDYRNQPDRDRTPSPAPIEGGAPLALEPWRPRAIQYPNY